MLIQRSVHPREKRQVPLEGETATTKSASGMIQTKHHLFRLEVWDEMFRKVCSLACCEGFSIKLSMPPIRSETVAPFQGKRACCPA